MKTRIKNFLIRTGWYDHIRYSILFSFYIHLFKRHVLGEHGREVAFYRSFLPHCHLIFDVGAFDGHKTAAFREIADKIVAIEPDEKNYRTLQVRFRSHRSSIFLENSALSDHPGTATYYIHHPGSAVNTLNPKWKQILEDDNATRWDQHIQFTGHTTVSLTTLDALIAKYGKPGFIKIDVEGYEQWVLRGLSVKVPYLSFETLVPDCEEELQNCLRHLLSLDARVTFNIAPDEKLLFEKFISYQEMLAWIPQAPRHSFEVIVKMTT